MRRLGFRVVHAPIFEVDIKLTPTGTNVAPHIREGMMVRGGEAIWLFFERSWEMSGPRESLGISVNELLPVR